MKGKFAGLLLALLLTVSASASPEEQTMEGYFGRNIPDLSVSFQDTGHVPWAGDGIAYMARYRIISGSDGFFRPDDPVTRAEFAKILVLSFGLEDAAAGSSFQDVPPGDWAYPYVSTVRSLGIAQGVDETHFGPRLPLTREQMVSMLDQAMAVLDILPHGEEEAGALPFGDAEEISAYARDAALRLWRAGMVQGDAENRFLPRETATRAQACKLIYSCLLKNT